MNDVYSPHTLLDLIQSHVQQTPNKICLTYLGTSEPSELTYVQFWQLVECRAANLQLYAHAGERALLLLEPGLDYVLTFFACLRAGIIAVPAYPPSNSRHSVRLRAIMEQAQVQLIIASAPTKWPTGFDLADQQLFFINEEQRSLTIPKVWPILKSESIAFLQYTSGSTGEPKGVMINHRNILANIQVIHEMLEGEVQTVCSWIPPYHDMGLIGCILYPLSYNLHLVLMTPLQFLKQPVKWLQAISDYKADGTAAPNFAYELCAKTIHAEEKENLDLSHLRFVINGSEPLSPSTLELFTASFTAQGYRPEAFLPAYGMAETTLMISMKEIATDTIILSVDSQALQNNRIGPAKNKQESMDLVSCGKIHPSYDLRIINPDTGALLTENHVGEILVRGPSVSEGYWQRPELNQQSRIYLDSGAAYFRTGDLGFLDERGELYVTGRLDDLLIIRGQNIYPQDIEYVMEQSHPHLIAHGGAAFMVNEELVLVQEVHRHARNVQEIFQKILQQCGELLPLMPTHITLIRQSSLPKTSSGKIQRNACRQAWINQGLTVVASWSRPVAEKVEHAAPQDLTITDRKQLMRWMRSWISQRFAVPEARVFNHENFAAFGMDSLSAVQFSAELSARMQQELNPALLWQYTTLEALAGYLFPSGIQPQAVVTAEKAATPIAIIGMSCRFPGASTNPGRFWSLLAEGRDGIRQTPPERTSYAEFKQVPYGGFIDNMDSFDAELFHINEQEAQAMDPQHRLLLELTWEALENAGLSPQTLVNSPTGIFIGISSSDYSYLQAQSGQKAPGAYFGLGNAHSAAAGRLAYFLGTRGEALAIDTACSSSLVAVAKACQDLQDGHCEMAIVGGVNALFDPVLSEALMQAGMLSPTGHCHVFDAQADGYVRSEGCGVLILKRLRDAEIQGDTILAVIKSAVINSDGHSNGLTAPNPQAQTALLAEALQTAGVGPDAVDYIEMHGTGTSLGDPIEFNAIKTIYATGTRTQPLVLGAVKSNLGHLEAAAGMAGLIKTVLMLQQCAIPKNLHFQQLNPLIDLPSIPAIIPQELGHWESRHVRCAGVSSFGFTGTNAHVLIQEYSDKTQTEHRRPIHLFTLSAQTPAALMQLKQDFIHLVEMQPNLPLDALCHTLNHSRSGLPYRLAFAVKTPEQLRSVLTSSVAPTYCMDKAQRVVFVFTGQSALYTQMGYALYQAHPLFKKHIDYCCSLFNEHLIFPLDEVLFQPGKQHLLQEPQYAQTALFALEFALAQLWMSLGIMPSMVVGHDSGEFVAAVIAHVMTVEEGAKLLVARIQWLQQPLENASDASFTNVVTSIPFKRSRLPFISMATGNKLEDVDGNHWVQLLTASLQVQKAIANLLQEDFDIYLEINPNPLLLNNIITQHDHAENVLWLTSMQQGKNPWDSIFEGLRKLYLRGFPIDWWQLDAPFAIRHFPEQLPNYPFARNTYWFSQSFARPTADYLYAVEWQKSSTFQAQPRYLKGKHLIFINPDPVSISLAHDLVQTPENLVLVTAGSNLDTADQLRALDPYAPAQFQQLIAELPDLREIVYLWGWKQHDDRDKELPEIIYARIRQASAGLLHLTQALSQRTNPPRIHVITQGASSAFSKISPWSSVLWGMSKTRLTESSSNHYQHIDFDPDFSPVQLGQFFLRLNLKGDIKIAAVKTDGIYKEALKPTSLAHAAKNNHVQILPGTVLITGGMGGIGKELCQELVARYEHIFLLGRRPLTAELRTVLHSLNHDKEQPKVSYACVDVSNRCALQQVVQSIQGQCPPIRGIIHAAGTLHDRMWNNLRWSDFDVVLQAKVCGAMNLHQVAQDLHLQLDFFVLCSSVSALIGNAGQGNYAAANAFMDAFAHWRQREKLPALSINFGPWQQLGMTHQSTENFSKLGIEPINTHQGRAVFTQLLEQSRAQICFLPNHTNAQQLAQLNPFQQDLLRTIISLEPESSSTHINENKHFANLSQLPRTEAINKIYELFMHMVCSVLHIQNPAPNIRNKTLLELGMDSMLAHELLHELKHEFTWIHINAQTLFFQNHTLNALVDIFYNELLKELPAPIANTTAQAPPHCFPLVPHQTEMMQYISHYPSSTAYNIPVFIEVEQRLEAEHVEQVILELIGKNELLRATIMTVYGQYFHSVHAQVSFKLPTVEVSEDELTQCLNDLYKKQINLEQAPLFNATLYYIEDRKTVLAFVFHHIIADGVSVSFLIQDLFAALSQDRITPPARAPFHQYVCWLLNDIYPDINDSYRKFWQNKLEGFKVRHLFGQSLPKRKPARNRYPLQGSVIQFNLDKKQLMALEQWVNRHQLTLASCLQAVVHKVLQEISGFPDSALVVFSNARLNEDWSDAIGQIAQHPAVRCTRAAHKSLPELAQTINEELAQMELFQFMPPFQLADFGVEIPKISFDYQSLNQKDFSLGTKPGVFLKVEMPSVDLWGDDPRHLAFKLLRLQNKGLSFGLKYRLDIYNREQAEQILLQCQTIILALIHDAIEELCPF